MKINISHQEFNILDDVSPFLYFSRWLAALVVVLSHMRAIAFPAFNQLSEGGIFFKFFYFVTSLGHEAVMIFFILSGYLIGGEIMKEMKNNNFTWRIYLTKRMVRLYIVLIPALILTAIFDNIGYNFYNQIGSYDRFFDNTKESLEVFFLNLFMLQHSHGPIFGSNDPLWSLAYEFWYYLLFPLIMQLFFVKSKKIKIASIGFILCILSIVSWEIIWYFFIWLLGVVIWFIRYRKVYSFVVTPYFFTMLFVISIVLSRYYKGYFNDVLVGMSYVMLVLYFTYGIHKDSIIKNLLYWNGHKKLADFSYSLYLLHFPIMVLIFNILYINYEDSRLSFSSFNFLIFFVGIFLIYLFSYLIYLLTESKTRTVTKKLLEVVKGNR
jgi:peptidoglycan/LPS O-acetylase OafA/YrhL